jgi:hypothetical protein
VPVSTSRIVITLAVLTAAIRDPSGEKATTFVAACPGGADRMASGDGAELWPYAGAHGPNANVTTRSVVNAALSIRWEAWRKRVRDRGA